MLTFVQIIVGASGGFRAIQMLSELENLMGCVKLQASCAVANIESAFRNLVADQLKYRLSNSPDTFPTKLPVPIANNAKQT